jgi:hypothetical protein
MPRSHGKERRAQKQKKRRQERQKARAQHQHRPEREAAAPPPSTDYRESCGYDANHAPAAQEWLALDERQRLDRVEHYHLKALEPARLPPSLPRHAGMHVGVENQLATGKPPQVGQAVARLVRDGMSRHDALHAVGWVMTEYMRRAVEERRPIDNDAYLRDLEQLSLQRWLAMADVKR